MSRTLAVLVAFGLMPGSMLPPPASHVSRGLDEPTSGELAAQAPELLTIGGPLLFVAGSTTLGAGDLAVKARLEALGFEVNVRSASSVQSGEAYDHNLVVVSSTVSPGSVNTKFRDVEKPVLTWEREIFDDMKMTGTTSGTHHGTDTNETKVTISASTHPLAAGLTGGPTVTTSLQTYAWGAPPATAIKAATIFNVPGRSAVFGYEVDAAMVGMNAPARRVGFFLGDQLATTLNANGWALFDAAVTWASNKASMPYFSPWGGTFTSPPSVEILCDTPGAEIRYTTNGELPTSSSTLYTGPIAISTTTELYARAFFPDWAPSEIAADTYTLSFGTVADPVLTPNGGSAVDSITASISAEPGATIRYTTDGSNPEYWSTAYSGTLTFTSTTELKARAFRTDYTPSENVSAMFHVKPPPPTLSLASGTYPLGQTVTVTAPAGGATLHYSVDGDEPTQLDPTITSGAALPLGSFTLKVNAWRPDQSPSESAEATYVTTGRITNGAVAAGAGYSLALRPDGTVLGWGNTFSSVPKLVNGLFGVKAIAAGGTALALKTDGTVWQCCQPVSQISALSNITAVASGPTHSMALQSNGVVWAWGVNTYGQLGDGTTTYSSTPVQVANLSNVQAIAVGRSHSLALTTDGYVWAWGYGGSGQIGDGFELSRPLPTQVRDTSGGWITDVVGIAAGGNHSLARRSNGTTWAWGSNNNGQVGGSGSNKVLASSISSASEAGDLAGGTYHSVTAKLSGSACTWGDNLYGQLGNGLAPTDRSSATCLAAPERVVQVAASRAAPFDDLAHTLVLTADGKIFAWGSNQYGQIGDGTTGNNRTTPVQVQQWDFGTSLPPTFSPSPGVHDGSVAVTLSAEPGAAVRYTLDGTAPFLHSPLYSVPITLNSTTTIKAIAWRPDANVSSVASGTYTVQVQSPQLSPAGGTFPSGAVTVVISVATPGAIIRYTFNGSDPTESDTAIPSGADLTLTSSGTLRAKAWKSGLEPSAVRTETYTLTGQSTSGSIASGGYHSLARTHESAPWGWGNNSDGQVGDGTIDERWAPTPVSGLAAVDALSAGGSHSLGLYQGQLWSWGENAEGQLGVGSTPTQSPVPLVVGLSGVSMVDAGDDHTLALKSDGTIWSWGRNLNGQLGDTTINPRNTPVAVAGLAGVTITKISAGANHSLGLDSLGRVWAWGYNQSGQLGDNSISQRTSPVLIAGFGGSTVAAVAAGGHHSLALTTNGLVYAWGLNTSGQLGDNSNSQRLVPTLVPSLTGVTAISAGGTHSLALKPTGLVWAWGSGTQVGDGAGVNRLVPVAVQGGLSGVVQVSAGSSHTLALTHDGSVFAWGSNGEGQLGDGTTTTRLLPVRVSGANFTWQVGRPVFSPTGPLVTSNTDLAVTITCSTPGATIHYTLSGADPTEADTVVASGGSVTLNQSLTLKAKAWKGTAPSSEVAATAYQLQLPQPVLAMPGYPLVGTPISATSPNPTATLRYRIDGNTPTEADPLWPSDYTLTDSVYLRVRGFKAGWTASVVASANLVAKPHPPVIGLASGSYLGPQTVALSTPVTNSRIHYTTDGRIPTDQDPFVLSGQTVLVDRSLNLKARVWRENWTPSELAAADYFITLDPPALPVFSPPAGSYGSTQTVSISTVPTGAAIRYTINGGDPGPTSPAYSGPIQVDGPLTLRAKAFMVDRPPSATATAAYAIALSTVAPPTFSIPSGDYAVAQTVHAASATPGATVRLTFDGSDPETADPVFPPSGLTVDGVMHVKARAFKEGLPPSPVSQASYWVVGMVDAGLHYSTALRPDGTLWTWGRNSWGQLGDGANADRHAPVRVVGPQVWRAVSAGSQHTLALDSLGQVWAWGYNHEGQLGDGTYTYHYRPALVSGLDDVVAVSAGGGDHSLALKADGTVWAWGSNASGKLGIGSTILNSNVPVQVSGLAGVARVVAAGTFSLALKTDGGGSGTVFVWGSGSQGQMGDGSAPGYGPSSLVPRALLTGMTSIGAGGWHGLARRTDGSLWTWGSQGSIFNASPAAVSGLPSVANADGGDEYSIAVAANGTAMGWGANANGRLGRGTSTSFEAVPSAVLGLTDTLTASVDVAHTLALRRDGSVMAWGYNYYGELGIGSTADQWQPVQTFPASLPSDPDGDGLATPQENAAGCDPYNFDTNGDGLLDGSAVAGGLSCSDLDMDDDGVQNLLERARGSDPFRPDTDDDGSNDAADCFPLDPARWECPEPDPGDHTPPIITLTSPTNATLISSVP